MLITELTVKGGVVLDLIIFPFTYINRGRILDLNYDLNAKTTYIFI